MRSGQGQGQGDGDGDGDDVDVDVSVSDLAMSEPICKWPEKGHDISYHYHQGDLMK